jgi:ABC-type transport system involved in cytochrome c biogenesis permease subunit
MLQYSGKVTWFTDRQFFLLAVTLYGVSTVYSVLLWRRGFRRDDRVNYLILLAGFGLHTVAMFKRGFSLDRCPITNLYEAIAFFTWTTLAIYLVLGLWPRFRFTGAFAAPLLCAVGVFALMPALDVRSTQMNLQGDPVSVHAALVLLSYGAFGLSFVAGLMYLVQERDLKFHKVRAALSLLPPIQRVESVIGRLMVAGFVLLTAGLVVGAVWLKPPEGVSYAGDVKVMWSILVWSVYLALLVLRWRFAQRGRRLAWGAVGTFTFVLLTFWGAYLLSAVHHP